MDEHFGFIHNKLDLKLLILYVLRHLPAEIDGEKLGTTPIYVRVQAIVAQKYRKYVEYVASKDEKGGEWVKDGDWYYFTRVLSGVDETSVLDVTVSAPKDEENQQSFNIVVAYEKTPAIEGMDYKQCWAEADKTGGE